jgi:hypothetical protein
MASKYAHIIDKLPKSFGLEPDEQAKVNALKKEILEKAPDPDKPEMTNEVLEELIMEVESMQEVINDALIRGVGGKRTAARMAELYKGVRIVKNAYDRQEKILNKIKEAYHQLLTDQYEVEGIRSLGLEDGGSVRVQYEPHAKVVDKRANRLWAIENNLENSLTLPWQTVNALTKDALVKGEEPPDGVEAESRPKVVYTKGD